MKKYLLSLMALAMSATTLAENKISIGAGVGVAEGPYKGLEKTVPIPMVDVQFGNMYLKGIELGIKAYENDMFALSLFVDPLSGFSVKGSDLDAGYQNISDKDYQAMGGIKLDVNTIYGMTAGFSAQYGEHGSEYAASLFKPFFAFDYNLIIVPSVHIIGYSDDYTDYYFGVTANEARNNVNINSAYTANASYSYGATLAIEYMLTNSISLAGFTGIEKYSDEVTNSPIVENDVAYILGIGAKYHF